MEVRNRLPPKMSTDRNGGLRDRIILVFDEHYALNGNVVFAATRHIVDQLSERFSYRVFCRGKYTGPRFKRAGKVRAVGRKIAPFAQGMRLLDRIARKIASYHVIESEERWICNLESDERPLLHMLFNADRCHAVLIFTHDPAYAARIVKLAHIYSTDSIPHLIVVTPALQVSPSVVEDLRRLGARILRDGEPASHWDDEPQEDSAGFGLGNTGMPEPGTMDPGTMDLGTLPDLGAMLDSFDYRRALSFLDRSVFPYQAGAISPQVVWDDWIGEDRSYRPRVRDVVLFIRPDWKNCGSGTLFESLAQWFLDNDGLLIDVGIWPFRVPFDIATRNEQIGREQRHIRSALYFSVRQSANAPYLLSRIIGVVRRIPWTIVNQTLIQYTLAAKPRLMTKALRKAKISHIYLNHYFTHAYASSLIGGRRFYLDTHDIQSINYVQNSVRNMITRRSDSFPAMFAEEMRVADLADSLGFVSKDEMELAATSISAAKLNFIIPIPSLGPCSPRPIGVPPRLLIVASGNRGNQRNVNWFLTEVLPIMSAQAGVPLSGESGPAQFEIVICGSVADFLPPLHVPGIQILGVVEDLREQYERCDVVLLPVISGGGVGVKTIEAVLYERPVVATFHALRGLPARVVEAIGYVDDAAMFARQVSLIVTSKAAHALQTERSRRGARALREENFYQRLGQAMNKVRLDPDEGAGRRAGALVESRVQPVIMPAPGD